MRQCITIFYPLLCMLLFCLGVGCSGGAARMDTLVAISPASPSLSLDETVVFSVTVAGQPYSSVTWSVSTGGGSITPDGKYTAPAVAGIYTVTVISNDDPSLIAHTTVYVGNTDATVGVQ